MAITASTEKRSKIPVLHHAEPINYYTVAVDASGSNVYTFKQPFRVGTVPDVYAVSVIAAASVTAVVTAITATSITILTTGTGTSTTTFLLCGKL
jgi:hypothetical protein